jgi:surfactin synthase thioesterase subunit
MPHSLLCLPFGGSGAGFYRAWSKRSPAAIRIVPLQLPGREERFLEEVHTDLVVAAKELAQSAVSAVEATGEESVAVFGHSLGAALAFELARELEAQGFPRVTKVFVSGSRAPWDGRTERVADLDDRSFVERMAVLTGYRHPALDDPDLREVLLPLLRADVAMHEDYRPQPREALQAPIMAIRGAHDALVTPAQSGRWATATQAGFTTAEIPGGHMYLIDRVDEVLALIATSLEERSK